ncbi:GntR family transcriptional regulator [Flexibacterium corallicola]|uniref:GntR family transcriptional regulator n=1 Tax=Flexibacterium corallicola TaxID=3037259 RepID=UPI00286EFFD0|nr:GntR family transcriptional regulator [Pseudovibrio sp. M1P-2-3]
MAQESNLPIRGKESLADKAYRLLEELIVNLDLSPGMPVTEGDLCEHLNIGRTPVREAIKRLSTEGLIIVQPRKGLFVSHIEPAEYVLVLETRRPLERLLVESVVLRATNEERAHLSLCGQEMMRLAKLGDVKGFLKADWAFDEVLCAVSRNPFTARSVAPLQTISRRAWSAFRGPERIIDSAMLHHALADAIAKQDVKMADQATCQLIDHLTAFASGQVLDSISA